MRRQLKGNVAEICAAGLVALHGYRLLKRNYACAAGEIDLIAQRRDVLAIIEVRLRGRGARVTGLESVDATKQQRIARTTAHFIARHPSYSFHQIRFDVVYFGKRDYAPHLRPIIRWIKNAFTIDPSGS